MDLTANLRNRVKKNSILRVKRSLQGIGKVIVSPGQEVEPQDILGKYQQSVGFLSLNLAKSLGVSFDQAERYLQRKKGERIFKGELLAEKSGLFGKKIVVSPTDAIIENYIASTGELRMRYLPKDIKLTAGVYGIIEQVNSIKNEVVIKTIATEINGVFGSGKERGGILNIVDGKGHLMSQTQIQRSMKGQVIVTGALIFKEALQKAVAYDIAGVISGGLNAQDFISMSGGIDSSISHLEPKSRIGTDIGVSVIATEGFGPISIGEDIFNQISLYEGKFVFVNGNSAKLILPVLERDIIMSLRNIVLPPSIKLPDKQVEIVVKKIELGSKVRIIWPPYVGSQGKVIGIDKTATTLASGVSTYMLIIETPLRKIKVPYPNVELIGN